MQIVFCSFAAGGTAYHESLLRIRKEATSSGYFNKIFCYTDESAPPKMKSDFKSRKEFYNNRGFGYWSWKPLLLEYVLDNIQDGDIVIYVDAGCQLSLYGKNRFEKYINYIERKNYLFFHMPPHLEKSYTAKKIVDLLNVTSKELDDPQIQATFFGLKKNEQSVELIKSWKEVVHTCNGYYVDDLNIRSVDSSFIDYRHDQSILSLLVKKSGIETMPYECHFNSVEYYPNSKILRFPVHSVRNRTGVTKDLHAFKYSSNKFVNTDSAFYIPIRFIIKLLYIAPKTYRFLKNRMSIF